MVGDMNLKFGPVINIGKKRQNIKFRFGYLFRWYFTDQDTKSSITSEIISLSS